MAFLWQAIAITSNLNEENINTFTRRQPAQRSPASAISKPAHVHTDPQQVQIVSQHNDLQQVQLVSQHNDLR